MSKKANLTGKRFGKLIALYEANNHTSKNGNKRVVWHCKCDCGNETDVMALNLTRNHTTSCGCSRADGRKKLIRDITNQRFGNLVGIKKIENKKRTTWLFKCDCGNQVECLLSNVTSGKTKSCGKKCGLLKPNSQNKKKTKGYRVNFVGQKFGRLTVLEQLEEINGFIYFKCLCDCGNEKIVKGSYLKYGNTKSCGCLHKEKAGKYFFEDLTGKRFNKLLVISQAPSKYSKTHWNCQCDCGNKTIVSGSGLKSGHTQSCGCYQDEVASNTHYVDQSGKKFGMLKVIKRIENSNTGIVRFKCLCDCGNTTEVASGHLLSGNIQSCGCYKQSHLERNVIKYFQSKNYVNTIDYECQKKFENLTGIGNGLLSYDFIIYKNNEPFCLIECQGQQHYQCVDYFGGKDSFERQQMHDELKKEYAKLLGLTLLEIPYTYKRYEDIKELLSKNNI